MFAKFPGSSPVDLGRGATPNSSPPLTNRSEEKDRPPKASRLAEGTKPRLDPPRRPEQSNGDTDTVQCGPNTMDLLGGFSCTGGRRKATTDSSLEEADRDGRKGEAKRDQGETPQMKWKRKARVPAHRMLSMH
eukprot:g12378.t1